MNSFTTDCSRSNKFKGQVYWGETIELLLENKREKFKVFLGYLSSANTYVCFEAKFSSLYFC